jgi:NADPH:quinone reductase-like Zn-dependent oxidoreductase
MKAVTFASYGPVEILRIEDHPLPDISADAVLVRVAAVGVNPADWRIRNGQFKRFLKIERPFVPGSDVAGTVVEVGKDVTHVNAGDAVFAMTPLRAGGACAEYVTVPARLVARAPRSLPLNDAAPLPLAGLTALQGLRDHGKLRAGQSLLVVGGSGGVGHLAVQIGKALGASVTALCGLRSFDFVRELGADRVIDYADPTSAARPGRYDVVFETLALAPFPRWRHMLRADGTVVTVNRVIGKVVPTLVTRMLVEPGRDDLDVLRTLVDDGKLKPAIQQRFAFEAAHEAYRLSEGGHAQGKLLIDID